MEAQKVKMTKKGVNLQNWQFKLLKECQTLKVCQPYVGMSHLWRYVNVGKFYSEIAYCEGFYAYVQGCKVNWAWCISIHRILDATQLSHSETFKFQVETLLFTLSISPSMMSQWTF